MKKSDKLRDVILKRERALSLGFGEAPKAPERSAGFFAIGYSDENDALWLSGFNGGINGVWTTDLQKALVFIHKRDADQLISMPGIAAYHPFCQWISPNAAPQSPKTSDGTERNESPAVAVLPERQCVDARRWAFIARMWPIDLLMLLNTHMDGLDDMLVEEAVDTAIAAEVERHK
jgi:hypothetical protein